MTTNHHLGQLLLATAAKYAHLEALSIKDDIWSYQQLHEFAGLLARGYALSTKKYCALLGPRHIGTLAGVVAALCYGKTYLPLHEEMPVDRLVLLSHSTGFDLLVTREQEQVLLQNFLMQNESPLIIILTDCKHTPSWCCDYPQHRFLGMDDLAVLSAVEPRSDNPQAYLMFTSGSTGTPKGVEVSHANVMRYVENTVALYQPSHYDRFSQLAPLSFDFSVHDLFVPWAVGASTHVFGNSQSMVLGRLIDEKRLTFWASVPSTILWLKRLRQLVPGAFPHLRQSLFCGEPLLHGAAESWHQAAPHSRIDNIYGPTEATVAVCGYHWKSNPSLAAGTVVPIGHPYPRTVLKIGQSRLDEPSSHEGELWIGGEQVVQGYWPGLLVKADNFTVENGETWYRTGDWATLDPEGCLHFLGRCDDQLKVQGQRIERLEIESMLRQISDTEDVAVVGWPIIEGNSVEGLVFFVSAHHKSNLKLRKLCQESMPPIMWPGKLVLGAIPKNHNGKTDYIQLRSQLEAESNASCDAEQPDTEQR
ncbi:AMP-binding protein [Providencia sp. PROV130]|uniref:AMP-binding protein n=1 Tax=Providencia sp. PROV130 TaxID=2949840 RepID=UPI00234AB090|nr:AMP-binding protein [Providencia sp. PROV130]